MASGYQLSENSVRKLAGLLNASPGVRRPPMSSGDVYRDNAGTPIVVNNTSGEIIPPYAVMQPHDYLDQSGKPLIKVKKWDGSYPGPFLFNSHNEIEIAGNGVAQLGPQYRCLYKSGYSPAAGDYAGPVSAQWYIDSGKPLMTVYGTIDTVSRTLVALLGVPDSIFIKAPSGGIPGRVGTLLGTASCDIYDLRGTVRNVGDSTKNATVLNWGVSAACASGDRYGWAAVWNMSWWIVSEDCADELQSASMNFTGGSPTEGDGDTGLVDEGGSGRLLTSGQAPTTGDLATWGTVGETEPLL